MFDGLFKNVTIGRNTRILIGDWHLNEIIYKNIIILF